MKVMSTLNSKEPVISINIRYGKPKTTRIKKVPAKSKDLYLN
jgi:hypothetical protein